MSNTATNYINLIRKDYPVRGKDNDSQGFRDNFTNISKALETINSDVSTLGNIAVLSNTTATFYGNNIEEANFKNCSTELWDNGTLSGNITLDYTLGSYQKLTVFSGENLVSIINWPEEGKSGSLLLAVYPAFNSGVYGLKFIADEVTSLGPAKNPYSLSSGVNLFEIYSEYTAGSENRVVHTRLLNEASITDASTSSVNTAELTLKQFKFDTTKDVTFKISTTTGTVQALVAETKIPKYLSTATYNSASAISMSANVAFVANKVQARLLPVATWPPGVTTSTLYVSTLEGIVPNSTFGLPVGDTVSPNNTTSFRVIGFTGTNGIIISPGASNPHTVDPYYITFRNPMFGDLINGEQYGEKTAFPTLITLLDGPDYIAANTSSGRIGVFRGSLYASANTLEITFADYNGTKNTFTASTMVSTTASNDSVDLANTQFVHDILPAGSIIMWYGDISNIPTGWKLCDGSTYTVLGSTATIKSPDLRNRFVIGADTDLVVNGLDPINSRVASSSILGQNTSTGGTAVAAIVRHNHVSTGTFSSPPHAHDITDDGHSHVLTDRAGVLAGDGVARADIDSDDRICLFGSYDLVKTSKSAETGIVIENSTTIITANLQVLHTGTAYQSSFGTTLSGQPVQEGDNVANIPPFYALAYIIKITGYRA